MYHKDNIIQDKLYITPSRGKKKHTIYKIAGNTTRAPIWRKKLPSSFWIWIIVGIWQQVAGAHLLHAADEMLQSALVPGSLSSVPAGDEGGEDGPNDGGLEMDRHRLWQVKLLQPPHEVHPLVRVLMFWSHRLSRVMMVPRGRRKIIHEKEIRCSLLNKGCTLYAKHSKGFLPNDPQLPLKCPFPNRLNSVVYWKMFQFYSELSFTEVDRQLMEAYLNHFCLYGIDAFHTATSASFQVIFLHQSH